MSWQKYGLNVYYVWKAKRSCRKMLGQFLLESSQQKAFRALRLLFLSRQFIIFFPVIIILSSLSSSSSSSSSFPPSSSVLGLLSTLQNYLVGEEETHQTFLPNFLEIWVRKSQKPFTKFFLPENCLSANPALAIF
jgi:hypothetical protein